jgi:hypothetical protein
MWKWKFIFYNEVTRNQTLDVTNESGPSQKLLKVIRLGLFDTNTG